MKKIMFVLAVVLGLSATKADAQYVRRRPTFSVGIHIGAPGPAPYTDGVWIGPEWTWRGGQYVEVPGHWEHRRHGRAWVPGHWRHTRRGDIWVRGHWR